MHELPLSVGYLHDVCKLIQVIIDNPNSNNERINEIISNDVSISENVSKRIITMSINIGWIVMTEDNSVHINSNIQDFSNMSVIELQRELLWTYIEKKQPSWVKYLHKGTKIVTLRIPNSDEKQVFQDLGLFVEPDNITSKIIQWWARAAIFSRSIINHQLLEIGNEGEILSLKFEKERTGYDPKHVAYHSHSYGYDIESIKDKTDLSPLYIEVKCSLKKFEIAKFYLSRSEYEVCKKQGSRYIFHIWDVSGETKKMITINGDQVLDKAPIDQEGGKWKSFSVAFSQFNWDEAYETE